jgi:hypothetical protein
MRTLLDEFKIITEALNDAKIEYAVCGGLAMAIHGIARTTIDIDLLVLAEDVDKIFEIAKTKGFDVEGLPLHFDVEIRRVSKVDQQLKQLITLDLLSVSESIRDVWESRREVSWEHGTTFVVSRDGLVKMKALAGRKQDLADIEKLRGAEDES